MRAFIAVGFITLVLLLLASLTTVQGQTAGGAKTDPKKGTTGKTTPPPSKNKDIHLNPSLSKGAVTLGSKDLQDLKNLKIPTKSKQPAQKFYVQQLKTSIDSGQVKLDPGQQAAWNKLVAQQPLTFDDRQQLSNLLFKGSQAGLTTEDEAALSYLLTDDLARHGSAAAPLEDSATPASGPLFLRAVNKTAEPIKVFVQIVAREPGETGSKKTSKLETLRYELQPGLAYDLQDRSKQRVRATVIRIWALSPTRQWASNRDQDLPLTASSASKVFVVTFAPPTAPAAGDNLTTAGAGKSK